MLRKILLIMSATMLLFAINSCDRFDHNFEPTVYNLGLEDFQDSFTLMWQSLSTETIVDLEAFVKDDYRNNNETKDDFVNYFLNLLSSNENSKFVVDTVHISNDLMINWNMQLLGSNNEIIENLKFENYLMKDGDAYKLYGNQNGSYKVVAELFTGTWCTFCPIAEAGLYKLKQEYSSRFDFVEYHINDALQANGNFEILQYYPNGMNLPVSILDGNFIMEGASEENYENMVREKLEEYLNSSLEIFFENVDFESDTTSLNITCNISTTLENTDDLYLKYILLDSHDEDHTNYNGEELHNVVLYQNKTKIEIGTTNSIIVNISINNNFEEFVKGDEILMWVQTMPTNFDENRTKIHNSYRIKIEN